MKKLSDNLWVLILAVVLVGAPMQTLTASVSKCTDMEQGMHHHMKASGKLMVSDMSDHNSKQDCCEKMSCDMSHCAGTIAAVFVPGLMNDMTYIVSNVYLPANTSLINFYPSTLYRPPRA